MKNKVFKFTMGLLAASAFVTPVGTVFAESGNIPTGSTNNITAQSSSSEQSYGVEDMPKSSIIGDPDIIKEGVTTEEIGSKLTTKGYQIVDIMRQVAVPICIGAFVVGAVIAIFGALSKKSTVIPGIIAMIMAGVGFALIYNAPIIMSWFKDLFN